jgi:hypothetical protein
VSPDCESCEDIEGGITGQAWRSAAWSFAQHDAQVMPQLEVAVPKKTMSPFTLALEQFILAF